MNACLQNEYRVTPVIQHLLIIQASNAYTVIPICGSSVALSQELKDHIE